jgi:hypothetical protein
VLEAAMVAPVLLLLVLGVFEFGLVYRDYLTVGDAVGDAVRMGSVQGPDMRELVTTPPTDPPTLVTADYSVVEKLREGTASLPPEWIDKIIIYQVDFNQRNQPALDLVPDSCRNGWASNSGDQCNVYPAWSSFYAVQNGEIDYFDCDSGNGPRACGWNPTTRDDGPTREEIDYIGVYISLDRELVTGMFGDSFNLERAQVLRLEPGSLQTL